MALRTEFASAGPAVATGSEKPKGRRVRPTYRRCCHDSSMSIEFGRTAEDYARHRAGLPPSLFERLSTFGVGLRSQDLGRVHNGSSCCLQRRSARSPDTDYAPSVLRYTETCRALAESKLRRS